MSLQISKAEINKFQEIVQEFYHQQGRKLPWRETKDPYKILVSEVMLQQTQVDRVIPKYNTFLKTFPTIQSLAKARLSEVLTLWIGLGYNRRARYLHKTAQRVVNEHDAIFPKKRIELETLPGIGPYTASAVATFAYNSREVFIETNIRTVYIHHFYPDTDSVFDKDILTLVEDTLPEGEKVSYREWYWALMDYGSHLKSILPNPSRKSKHYTVQSKFKGSLREARGFIIRVLTASQTSKEVLLHKAKKENISSDKIEEALHSLLNEDFIEEKDKRLQLCDSL
jgi:A/G-specific adenine glycosylase